MVTGLYRALTIELEADEVDINQLKFFLLPILDRFCFDRAQRAASFLTPRPTPQRNALGAQWNGGQPLSWDPSAIPDAVLARMAEFRVKVQANRPDDFAHAFMVGGPNAGYQVHATYGQWFVEIARW